MRFICIIMALPVLVFPSSGGCYPVESAANCKEWRNMPSDVTGVIGSVRRGERAFLTLSLENGDEFIMIAEDPRDVDFFIKNKNKSALVKYQKSNFFFADDFSDKGPGNCEEVYYFKSAKIME